MQIYNDGIPKHVYDWIMSTKKDRNTNREEEIRNNKRIYVTELIDSHKAQILGARHKHKINAPASSMIKMMVGSVIHNSYENDKSPDTFSEVGIVKNYQVNNQNWELSGRIDKLLITDDGQIMIDEFKTGSVWKYRMNDYGEYLKQLLLYYQMFKTGANLKFNKDDIDSLVKVMINPADVVQNNDNLYIKSKNLRIKEELSLTIFFGDWKQGDLEKSKDNYPAFPVVNIIFNISEISEYPLYVESMIEGRLNMFELSDDEIPECSSSERWERGGNIALYEKFKNGNFKARAKKLYNSAVELINDYKDVENFDDNFGIEIRPYESKRCKDYCFQCHYCNFYKEHIENAPEAYSITFEKFKEAFNEL